MINTEQLRKDLAAIVVVDPWGGKYDKETDTFASSSRSPTVFSWKDDPNTVRLSAEDGGFFCDYYDEYGDGYPKVHAAVEAVAKKHKCIIEWYDPSHVAFYEE